MIIKPSSELRNNFNEISKIVREKGEPVFLTRNGTGDMVVMSLDHYNAINDAALLELYQSLSRAEKDIAADKTLSFEEFDKNTANWVNNEN